MDSESGNEQGGDAGGWDGNDEDGANNDGGACVRDEDDLEDMIRALGPEILLNSPKGLENLERVTKASKETVYGVEKGCSTHWTLLCFVLELLIMKAKYGWLDYSFNDLLHLLSWVLPQPNSVLANTYQAKKVISPLAIGVEKSMHTPTIVYFFMAKRSSHWINVPGVGPTGTRTMTFTVGDEASTGKKRNKKGTKKVVQKSQPLEDTPLGNDAKQRRIPTLVM
jgi:hypothetical protein